MTHSHLTYTVRPHSTISHTLQIDLIISSPLPQNFDLFKGKLKVISFSCNGHYSEDPHFYHINMTQDHLAVSYCVQIGTPGKHGYNGDLSEDLTVFSGDQVFLFPADLLSSHNTIPAPYTIRMHFEFSNASNCLIPFAEDLADVPSSFCSSPLWHHMYELMKSPYIFGHLAQVNLNDTPSHLKVYLESHWDDLHAAAIQEIKNIYHYYAQLFGISTHDLTLTLLSSTPKSRLGGCGAHMICSSFDPKSLRDWQLLSHRMFHSFMDTLLPLSDFHMPPHLWLTEGLATYYENIALSALSKDFSLSIGLDLDKEFNRLFTRYLYMKQKPSSAFCFPPMAESQIRSAGKLEFLHYTHAPLIIKYIEDYYTHGSHHLLKLLLKTDLKEPFSMEKLFVTLLGHKVDDFARNYLFGDHLLPLWDLKITNTFSGDELIEDLNYYEYLLYTWMILEDPYYHQEQIPHHLFKEMPHLQIEDPVVFNPFSTEKQVKDYSPDLYYIIKYLTLKHN